MKKIKDIIMCALMISTLTLNYKVNALTVELDDLNKQMMPPVIAEQIELDIEFDEPAFIEVSMPPARSEDDILIAKVVMNECQWEPELGQRLVIDTILNRIESSSFPDNLNGVLTQKGQYTCVTDGSINRWEPEDYIFDLIAEERVNRTNSSVYFYRNQHYHEFGTPVVNVGNHYFSTL